MAESEPVGGTEELTPHEAEQDIPDHLIEALVARVLHRVSEQTAAGSQSSESGDRSQGEQGGGKWKDNASH